MHEYLGLEGGPPNFRQDFTCPALLMDHREHCAYGLSPTLVTAFQPVFGFFLHGHWPGPRSLATTNESRLMSFPRVLRCFSSPSSLLTPMYSKVRYLAVEPWSPQHHQHVSVPVTFRSDQGSEVGCPIRKSTDQSLFAAPHGLSQRITSFIACACQGIHQMPLRHLIVLIAHDHRELRRDPERDDHERFILFEPCKHRPACNGCRRPAAWLLPIPPRARGGTGERPASRDEPQGRRSGTPIHSKPSFDPVGR